MPVAWSVGTSASTSPFAGSMRTTPGSPSARSTATIEPSGWYSRLSDATPSTVATSRIDCVAAWSADTDSCSGSLGRLARGEGEHDRSLRVLRDGQLGLPGELARPRLAGLAVGSRALHERVRGHRRHHDHDADEDPAIRRRRRGPARGVAIDRVRLAARNRRSSSVSSKPDPAAHDSASSSRPPPYRKLVSDPAAIQSWAADSSPPSGEQVVACVVDPALEPLPLAEQRLVGDLDGRCPGRRHRDRT